MFEGSANIFNHVNGSRNHLDSLLESGKLVETLESGIIISTYIFGYLHKNESHDAQALIWLTGITKINSGILESSQDSKDSRITSTNIRDTDLSALF